MSGTAPVGGGIALNGNLATTQTALSSSLDLATPLAEGEYIFLRWADADQSGADHGLAIDNLSLTVVPEPVSITLIALGIGLIAFRIRRQA